MCCPPLAESTVTGVVYLDMLEQYLKACFAEEGSNNMLCPWDAERG